MKFQLILLFSVCVFDVSQSFPKYTVQPLPKYPLDGYDGFRTISDFITDVILAEVRHYLNESNETSIPLPPIDVTYNQHFIGINFSGEFKAFGGVFKNPATIKREGPSKIVRSQNSYVLSFYVGFKEMSIYFPSYSATALGFITETGDIFVGIGKNSVFIEVTVRYLPHCVVSLSKVEIEDFEDLEVKISGLSFLDSLENQIIEWVLASYKEYLTPTIEQVIQSKLQEELAKTSLCKYKKEKP